MEEKVLKETKEQQNSNNNLENLTKEELLAMQVMGMINGASAEQVCLGEKVEGLETEAQKKKRSTKKSKTTSKTNSKTTSKTKSEPVEPVSKEVPMLDIFKQVKNNIEVDITYNEHDIHYKEQLWGIPERTVTYSIRPVKSIKSAKDISNLMNNNSLEEREKAEKGLTRYYSVVTNENVLHKLHEIGYVRVTREDKKLKASILVKSKLLKDCSANPDKVKKKISKKVQLMLQGTKVQ